MEIGDDSPLARPYRLADGRVIGNRFCIQPMEGWDGTRDGKPSALTLRRWQHFGQSGAKLIWGGEAVSVLHEGRANARQLLISEPNLEELTRLRQALVEEHTQRFGQCDDLLVGLQLTHSGRFARPNGPELEPRILYHHPILDPKFGIPPDYPTLTDGEISEIIASFVRAAELAYRAGFEFVDIKHCHGYLGHEFLTAVERPGSFGGSFENRTRFLREIVLGIRRHSPDLRIGVRLSAFDTVPFSPGPEGIGVPIQTPLPYHFAFGADASNPLQLDLHEPIQFLRLLEDLQIELVNITGGSPYYNPHIQRPALFPPSDGYKPPEDPLAGVARHIQVCTELKAAFPRLLVVGSAYTYLQEWLPHVAQRAIRAGATDFVGLGRMVLSYPEMPTDVLSGKPLDSRRICRTFSDCTTAPRHGLVSGCYPLDGFYRERPEKARLVEAKRALTGR
ncbi:MAG: NADH:flavin oxidoreductase [Chloroflexi bacterium]|nr:NADH:flavin oxidoreductase [Chloroflexota bacterium]